VQALADVAKLYNIAWRGMDVELVKSTSERLYGFAREVVEDRRRDPREPENDPTSALLAQRYEGEPIPDEFVVATVRQVLVVGLMAPPPLFGAISIHLSRDPALQDRLRADPSLIPAAFEEFLRLYTPYRGFARTPARPIELHGRTIMPGEPIAMVYSSANRDESVFEDADQFRMDRPNIMEHVAFGRGPHRCAGMQLVRMEFRIALEELLARTAHIEICGPIETTRLPELGPISTPVRLHAAVR
jgi:cytochrome P450